MDFPCSEYGPVYGKFQGYHDENVELPTEYNLARLQGREGWPGWIVETTHLFNNHLHSNGFNCIDFHGYD